MLKKIIIPIMAIIIAFAIGIAAGANLNNTEKSQLKICPVVMATHLPTDGPQPKKAC